MNIGGERGFQMIFSSLSLSVVCNDSYFQLIHSQAKIIDDVVKKESLPRLNDLAQDGLDMLSTAQSNLDLIIPQLPSNDHIQNFQLFTLQSWDKQIQSVFDVSRVWLIIVYSLS